MPLVQGTSCEVVCGSLAEWMDQKKSKLYIYHYCLPKKFKVHELRKCGRFLPTKMELANRVGKRSSPPTTLGWKMLAPSCGFLSVVGVLAGAGHHNVEIQEAFLSTQELPCQTLAKGRPWIEKERRCHWTH